MRRILPLLAGAFPNAIASQHAFSVHDDILAFPQYAVVFSDTFILDTDAFSHLASSASSSATPASPTHPSVDLSPVSQQTDTSDSTSSDNGSPSSSVASYEFLRLNSKPYLCAIPAVSLPTPRNATDAAAAALAEAAELARASTRGWELLQEMNGVCLYFISGYWSYKFCYGQGVRQFHQLPPGKDVPLFPPTEDRSAPAFILGTILKFDDDGNEVKTVPVDTDNKEVVSGARPIGGAPQVQRKGEARYLMQQMSNGTMCDLTNRPRKVEIQFHCHPHATERIGWIKEVTTCSYLMVINTPRLCSDAAFMPPHEDRPNAIACRQVIRAEDVEDWKRLKANEAAKKLGAVPNNADAPKKEIIVGGVSVGAQLHVGGEGKRLIPGGLSSDSKEKSRKTVAWNKKGEFKRLTDKELEKLNIDPKAIEDLRRDIDSMSADATWKLDVIEREDGERELQNVRDDDRDEQEQNHDDDSVPEGSEEELKEDL